MPIISRADKLRPGFDLSLELLCSIPRSPAHVRLESLVRDLEAGSQRELQKLVVELKSRGFGVRVSNHPTEGRVAYIARMGWEHAEAAAETYWEMVWGREELGGAPGAAA